MIKHFKLLALACITFISMVAHSQNKTISIQSTLRTIGGDAVPDGNQSITFRLYTTETGGSHVWTETATVEVTSGIYSHDLGSVEPLDNQDFSEQLYLGVTVGTGQELSPRTKLGYAPYAMAVGSITGEGNAAYFQAGGFSVSSGINANGQIYTTGDIENNGQLKVGGKAIIGNGSSGFTPTYTLNLGNTSNGIDYPTGDKISIMTGSQENAAFRIIGGEKLAYMLGKTAFGFGGTPLLTISVGDNNTGLSGTNDTLHLHTNGNKRMTIMPNGRVGIGTTSPNSMFSVAGPLVTATSNSGGSPYALMRTTLPRFDDGTIAGGNNISTQIVSDFGGTVLGTAFLAAANFTFSDVRIKKNLYKSNSLNDLITLSKLEITDYDHIDQVKNDSRTMKKVIAQQVKQVYPVSVSEMKNIIPSIFENAIDINLYEGTMALVTQKEHQLVKGNYIDIITKSGLKQNLEVIKVIDKHSFEINYYENTDQVFVYGKYVDDFLMVDYDAISMLNVSATQELYKRILALEAENKSLKVNNTSLKVKQETLDGRLAKLEKMMSANAENNGLTMTNEE